MDKTLVKMADMQREFAKMYSVTGLITISDEYVHLTDEKFTECFGKGEYGQYRGWWEHEEDGTKFICVREEAL